VIDATDDGVRIHLHVVPRASRTQVAGVHDGRVKLQVAAPPVDGEANDAIVRWAAKLFGVTRDAVVIASGATGKRKTIEVAGIDVAQAYACLQISPPESH
jgi:uncharacterized protein (TIGR00251 family)